MDVHDALKAPDDRYDFDNLMQIYFSLPSWDRGPLAVELAQSAAAVAQHMGAPGFAGNLLASSAREIPDARLSHHLLMAANAFIRAEDFVRARVVAEYVQTRLGMKGRTGEGWRGVMKTLASRADEDEVSADLREQIEKEVAATLAGLDEAKAAMAKARALVSGVKDAKKGSKAGKDDKDDKADKGEKADAIRADPKAQANAKPEAEKPAPADQDRPKTKAEGGG
jgi:hypothetical protein